MGSNHSACQPGQSDTPGKQHGPAPRHRRAHGKVENSARFGLAQARQRHHLHVGKCGGQAGHQPDQSGKGLVLVQAGAQHQHNAHESGEYGENQRPLQGGPWRCRRRAPGQQRAADQEGGDPHAAHVVERHGRGQRQVGNGVEPCAQRRHPYQAAPGVHAGVLRGQRHFLRACQQPQDGHADQTPVAHQFGRVEEVRCDLDAHAHAGKQERGQHHPEGLHRDVIL